jgi:mono/diheme cytochrome c family protein
MKRHLILVTLAILLVASVRAQQGPAIPSWSRTNALVQDRGSRMERGAAVFNNWCAVCHGKDIKNSPGTISLQFKYQGKLPAALEERRDLTAEFVKFTVRKGVATMPFFRKTEINDTDLDALATYLARPEAH